MHWIGILGRTGLRLRLGLRGAREGARMIGRESARHGVSHSPVGPPVILSGQSVKRDVRSVNHLGGKRLGTSQTVGRRRGESRRGKYQKRGFFSERRRKRQENRKRRIKLMNDK